MTNEDINKKVESVVNSIDFIEDEDYKYLHKEGVEIEVKKCFEKIESLRIQLSKANERISQYESKQDKGADLLIKLAKSNASMASLELELAKANERVRELEQNQLPIENGENRYGLDVSYFRNVINRELNRSLYNYKPDELARVLARISRTADKSVMFEPEFSKKFAIEKKIEGAYAVISLLDETKDSKTILMANNYVREQLRKEQNQC